MKEKLLKYINSSNDLNLVSRASNNEFNICILSEAVGNGGTSNADTKYQLKILQKSDVIDLNLKSDYNEKLLQEIGANLREIDANVKETGISLKGQGDSLKQVSHNIDQTENNLNRANKTISSLSWGQRIQLILLNLIAILLFIGIILLILFKLVLNSNSGSNNN